MTVLSLAQSVEAFANFTQSLTDADLDCAWAWGDYDSEGVRFAFFRVYEELRTLAVKTSETRADTGHPPTSAQRILAQYHGAYRDLQAALLGVPAEWLDLPPGEGQWSVREALSHIVGADAGFFAVISHSVSQLATAQPRPPA